MTNIYVLKNSNNEILRTVRWDGGKLYALRDIESGRLHFSTDLNLLASENRRFEKIKEMSPTTANRKSIDLGPYGTLSPMKGDETLQKVLEPTQETEDRLPVFLKRSAATYVALLALVLISSWIGRKFFADQPETVVVQVIQQKRDIQPKAHTVKVAKNPVKKTKKRVTKTRRPRKVAQKSNTKSRQHTKAKVAYNKRAAAQNLHKVGALGALGGLSKSFEGAGGLNKNATKNNPGMGYGGAAAKGGHERSLVGKGLVAGGAGNGGTLKGYGGYGTKGQGGGRPGYGSMRVGGSSAAFFQPLSDESFVEGGLDKDQINAVIQRNRGEITYCYEKGLQKDPGLSGRVDVKFVINPQGRVSAAKVQDTSLDSRNVENCIVSKLRKWKFPKPVGDTNVRVDYPFHLKRLSRG